MSKVAPLMGIIGMILVSFEFPLYGMLIWSISNPLLAYINRNDKGQIYMYVIYEIFSIIGAYNYLN